MHCQWLFSTPPFSDAPFLSDQPLPSVSAPLHSVPSSFSPHLPVFCALSSLPPSFVCLSPTSSIVPPVPPISALELPFDPAPRPPCPPPVPPADGDPKSSCSSLDCTPLKFFFFFWEGRGWLITVASKRHTKSQRDCYCEAYNGIQAVMAISNRGAWPVSSV